MKMVVARNGQKTRVQEGHSYSCSKQAGYKPIDDNEFAELVEDLKNDGFSPGAGKRRNMPKDAFGEQYDAHIKETADALIRELGEKKAFAKHTVDTMIVHVFEIDAKLAYEKRDWNTFFKEYGKIDRYWKSIQAAEELSLKD